MGSRKKLAIIVGHNAHKQGANAVNPIGLSEFMYNSRLAVKLGQLASTYGLEVQVFYRNVNGSTRREVKEVYDQVNSWGAERSIELHFNSYNAKAGGTETLVSESEKSFKFGKEVQEKLVALFGREGRADRGVKTRYAGQRGAYSLYFGRCPAVLVEPFFGDNYDDVCLAHEKGLEPYAKALLEATAEDLGIYWNKEQPEDFYKALLLAKAQGKSLLIKENQAFTISYGQGQWLVQEQA